MWIDTIEGARWFACPHSARVGRRIVIGGSRRAPWLLPRMLIRERGQFREAVPAEHHGYGRPRNIDTQRDLMLYVAWACDIVGDGQEPLALALYGSELRAERHEIRRVERYAAAGRSLYRKLGVLPGMAFEGAPPRRWWQHPAFRKGVRAWQVQAVAHPTDEPQPDPTRAQRAAMERATRTCRAEIMRAARAMAGFDLAKLFPPMTDFHAAVASLDTEALRDRALIDRGITPWSPPGD
jgi:hypothetical protein